MAYADLHLRTRSLRIERQCLKIEDALHSQLEFETALEYASKTI